MFELEHANTVNIRSLVHHDSRNTYLRVQCPQLLETRLQGLFYNEERVLRKVILKNGEPIQIQICILRSPHRRHFSHDDPCTYRFHGKANMRSFSLYKYAYLLQA